MKTCWPSRIDAQGYLAQSNWIWNGDGSPTPSGYSRGEAIFRGECGSCHTLNGYRAMRVLIDGRDSAEIRITSRR